MTTLYSFDTETYLITDNDKAPKPVCCSWWDGSTREPWLTHPGDDETLAAWSNPDAHFVGQNMAYDLGVMMRWHPYLIPHIMVALDQGRVWDTQIRQQLIHLETKGEYQYPSRISLADMETMYLGKDRSADKKGDDVWRLKYGTLDGVPFSQWPKKAVTYALDDAVGTWQVFFAQGSINHSFPTESLQVQASVGLQLASIWGMHINKDNVANIDTYLQQQRQPLETALNSYKVNAYEPKKEQHVELPLVGKGSKLALQTLVRQGWRLLHRDKLQQLATDYQVAIKWDVIDELEKDPNWDLHNWIETSNKTIGEMCESTLPQWCYNAVEWNPANFIKAILNDIPRPAKTKTGLATGENEISPILPYVEILKTRFEFKHNEKMASTYVKPYQNMNEVHPRFTVLVTTGRTSCAGPNIQNIPRFDKDKPQEAYRKSLRARDGYLLGTVDYSAQELCTLAATILHRYGESKMADYINKGMDLHCMTAAMLFNSDYDTVYNNKSQKPYKDWRQGSKACNFGLPGGLGKMAFQSYAKYTYGVEWTIDETAAYIKQWKAGWPEIRKYLKDNGDMCDNGEGRTMTAWNNMGRKKANCTYTQGSNYPFQSLAADCSKSSLWELCKHNVLGWFWTEGGIQNIQRAFSLSQIGDLHSTYKRAYYGTPLRRSHTVNLVHDEIVQEHPEDLAQEAFELQQSIMVNCMDAITVGVKSSVEGELDKEWDH